MVTKLEPKTEGTSGACNVCGTQVVWVAKTWQGKTSLTLRNVSGQQAHSKQDGVDSNGKTRWVCNTGLGTDGFDTPTQPKEPYEYKILTEENITLYKAIVAKVCEYDILGDEEIAKYPVDQSGQSKGRIKNISAQVLRDILAQQREES